MRERTFLLLSAAGILTGAAIGTAWMQPSTLQLPEPVTQVVSLAKKTPPPPKKLCKAHTRKAALHTPKKAPKKSVSAHKSSSLRLASLTEAELRLRAMRAGWKVLPGPGKTTKNRWSNASIALSQGANHGMVFMIKGDKENHVKRLLNTMDPSATAIVTEGTRALMVIVPGNKSKAQTLLNQLAPLPRPAKTSAPQHTKKVQSDILRRGAQRLDHEGLISANNTRIDFRNDPYGARIRAGQNLEQTFRPWGVVFDSTLPTSYLSADSYVVSSPSRGMSAANKAPRWTADITAEFVDKSSPYHANRTHNVHSIGVYVAHVYPGGTGMAAYDRNGRELARIYTRKTGSDFLGLRSNVPIASVRLFAVPNIDPNFTFDDFIFADNP